MPDATSQALSKLPAITLAFWVMKIAATTLGETLGDFLSKGPEMIKKTHESAPFPEGGRVGDGGDAWAMSYFIR